MAWPKGVPRPGIGSAGKGRRKGSRNKITRDLREMVQKALEELGGVNYLLEQGASKDPRMRVAFLTLVGKTMPVQSKVELEGGITVVVATGVPERANSVR